jgi:IS30 family transposase
METERRKGSHLTSRDRKDIQLGLESHKSCGQIAREIGVSVTTVVREIRKHGERRRHSGGGTFNDCMFRSACKAPGDNCSGAFCQRQTCNNCRLGCGQGKCPHYRKQECERLRRPPYVCNGCGMARGCRMERFYYNAALAQHEYASTLRHSREGLGLSPQEIDATARLIAPQMRKGQSIYHIYESNKAAMLCSARTLYTYVEKGIFKPEGVDNYSLPMQVSYRRRKSPRHEHLRVDRQCHVGRTRDDFEAYLRQSGSPAVVEMDTVVSAQGDLPAILTLHFVSCHLQLGFHLRQKTASEVVACFDRLWAALGPQDFRRIFPVILTDRGTEFTLPQRIELDSAGRRRTRVFYCDPLQSQQKAHCEKNHVFIRRILPKSVRFSSVGLDQDKVSLMMSHINSYRRKDLEGRSPFEVFEYLYGPGLLQRLGIRRVPDKDIVLKPSLLQ